MVLAVDGAVTVSPHPAAVTDRVAKVRIPATMSLVVSRDMTAPFFPAPLGRDSKAGREELAS